MEILWTPIIGRIGYESKGRMVSYVYSAISHLSRFSESFGVKEINWSVTAQFMNRRAPKTVTIPSLKKTNYGATGGDPPTTRDTRIPFVTTHLFVD